MLKQNAKTGQGWNRAAVLIAMGMVTLGSNDAGAISIVDTGEPASYQGGWCLHPGQWLAGEFQVSQGTLVTGIEGFFGASAPGGTVTAAIYADDSASGEVPGALLYSTTFQVASTGLFPAAWAGASGLTWNLSSGNYWVSFEIGAGSLFSGYMPGNAPTPLVNEAFNLGNGWHDYDSVNMGVRIRGDQFSQTTTNVPDGGATSLLFGIAVVAMVTVRQRFNR
jgi:hypothetical protein